MPSKKKPKIDSPFVSIGKLKQTIETIKKVMALRDKQKSEKKPLIEDQSESMVRLQVSFKKTPYNKTTFIHSIPLPNHWRHESDYETCLIVKDVNKTPLTDRDLDLEQTKAHYRELLSKDNSDQLVTEILPMRELRNEYKLIEAKQRVCKSFDVFLCDRTLLHNKFDYLSRFLGKTFWIDQKKVPIPVDLTSGQLRADLETKLNKTQLYLSGKGDSSAVNIGLIKQSTEGLVSNLLAVNRKLLELFGHNIRSLSVKTDKSIAITFFLDCAFITGTELKKSVRTNDPIEDEFSHFTHSNVQIFKSGDIKVVPKPEEEIDSEEQMDYMESKWRSMSQKKVRKSGKRKKIRFFDNKRIKRKTNKNSKQKTVESVEERVE